MAVSVTQRTYPDFGRNENAFDEDVDLRAFNTGNFDDPAKDGRPPYDKRSSDDADDDLPLFMALSLRTLTGAPEMEGRPPREDFLIFFPFHLK